MPLITKLTSFNLLKLSFVTYNRSHSCSARWRLLRFIGQRSVLTGYFITSILTKQTSASLPHQFTERQWRFVLMRCKFLRVWYAAFHVWHNWNILEPLESPRDFCTHPHKYFIGNIKILNTVELFTSLRKKPKSPEKISCRFVASDHHWTAWSHQ